MPPTCSDDVDIDRFFPQNIIILIISVAILAQVQVRFPKHRGVRNSFNTRAMKGTKKRRPKKKAAELDLWMKEWMKEFAEQFIDVTKEPAATEAVAPAATEAVADEPYEDPHGLIGFIEDPYGFMERESFEKEQADKAAADKAAFKRKLNDQREAKWCNW